MDNGFSDLQEKVREANNASIMSLECATYVLRRALELPLDQRKGMIERLKQLISVTEDRELIPLPKSCLQQTHQNTKSGA